MHFASTFTITLTRFTWFSSGTFVFLPALISLMARQAST
jgi:hypothetical protein